MTGIGLLAFATLNIGKTILIGALAGAVAAAIAVVAVLLSYARKNRSPSYPLRDFSRLELTESRDTFTGKHVTRRVIRTNNRRK